MPNRFYDSAARFPGTVKGSSSKSLQTKLYISKNRSSNHRYTQMKVSDADTYYNEMSKSLQDKLFFLNHIAGSLVIDYGCGDGSVLFALRDRMTGGALLGFDTDETALKRANDRFAEISPAAPSSGPSAEVSPITFTSQWGIIEENVKQYQNYGIDTTFVLNSVIHEVLSYGDDKNIAEFWKRLYNSNVTNIVIRDMMPSSKIEGDADENSVSQVRSVCNASEELAERLAQFEDIWGSIDHKKNFTHFLLKYRFKENWDREVRENYFPIFIENLLENMPIQYDVSMIEQFSVPFVQEQVKKDFDIDFDCKTHVKLILKRENIEIHGDPVNP